MAEGKQKGLVDNLIDKMVKKPGAKGQKKIPKTALDSVPYLECYENGVFQSEPGVFTQSFEFQDISFKTRSDEEQERIYEDYQKFLNAIAPKRDVFITVVNSKDSAAAKAEAVVAQEKGDELDVYRREMSDMIKSKMKESNNSIKTTKLITVRVEAPSVDEGMKELSVAYEDVEAAFKKFTKQKVRPLTLAERLSLIHEVTCSEQECFYFEHDQSGKVSVDFADLARRGLTTKDIVCPEFLKFNGSDFEINEKFGQAMYLDSLSNWLNSNFFTEVSSLPFEGVVTLHISAIPQEEAIKMVHNRAVSVRGEAAEKQKTLGQDGYAMDMLPADLKNALQEIEALQDDLLNRDQKLFFITMSVVHFADTKEELKKNSAKVKSLGTKYMCSIKTAVMQQERTFASALPVGIDKTKLPRLMTTESLGIMIPFDEVNQFDKGGFYYGVNSINKSLVVYNRLKGQNYNGLVLGSSGSGKSFSAKREMVSVILNSDSDIYIVDPDGEYSPIAEAFGGSVIKIAPGNGVYINPFDLDLDMSHDADGNPIAMKADFIAGILETMLGQGARLSPIQKSIVDKCIHQIYRPYIEHLTELPPDKNGKKKTIDRAYCPTMSNLFDALLSQGHPEAQQLAIVMEEYTTGTYDAFAHRTNVDLENRIIVYDIKDIGANLSEIAMKVCLNDVWNKMMENRRNEKWTWFYIDEFHTLLSNASTSSYLKMIWKRARKWQGVPTGITQNVEDLLASTEARAIINNSSFVYLMNQSAMDRNMLGELLNLTEADKEAITNVDKGCGLIHTGRQTIPFQDSFPENTQLFKIMTTKPKEE